MTVKAVVAVTKQEKEKEKETIAAAAAAPLLLLLPLLFAMLAPSLLYLPSLISGGNLPFLIRSRIAILPMDSTDKIASSGPTNSTEVHSKVQMAGANIHPQLAQHFATFHRVE